ncbi:MAG: hypothetical protein WDW38_002339 [Sanguina aurantia]
MDAYAGRGGGRGGGEGSIGGRSSGFGGAGGRGFRGTAENAKTKLCTRWLQGDCRFGERCNFAHGETELRGSSGGPEPGGGGGGGGGPGRGYAPGGRGGGRGGSGGYQGQYQGRGGGYPGRSYEGGGYQQPGYGGGNNYDAPMSYMPQSHAPQETRENWVQRGCPVPGPNGWTEYRSQDTGEAYYNNSHSGLTQWEKPHDWSQ